MQTNLAFQDNSENKGLQTALRQLGERWPVSFIDDFSARFITQITTIYGELLSVWPDNAGPEESLELLSADIAGQIRPTAERFGVDTFGLSISCQSNSSDEPFPYFLLYDIDRGVRVSFSENDRLLMPERALWVGYAPLDEAEKEKFLDFQRQKATEPPSNKILANLQAWQKGFLHSLAAAQADALLSIEAQASLLGLLKQGRAFQSALLLAQQGTSSNDRAKVKSETQKMRTSIVRQLSNGSLPESLRTTLRLSLKRLDKATEEKPLTWLPSVPKPEKQNVTLMGDKITPQTLSPKESKPNPINFKPTKSTDPLRKPPREIVLPKEAAISVRKAPLTHPTSVVSPNPQRGVSLGLMEVSGHRDFLSSSSAKILKTNSNLSSVGASQPISSPNNGIRIKSETQKISASIIRKVSNGVLPASVVRASLLAVARDPRQDGLPVRAAHRHVSDAQQRTEQNRRPDRAQSAKSVPLSGSRLFLIQTPEKARILNIPSKHTITHDHQILPIDKESIPANKPAIIQRNKSDFVVKQTDHTRPSDIVESQTGVAPLISPEKIQIDIKSPESVVVQPDAPAVDKDAKVNTGADVPPIFGAQLVKKENPIEKPFVASPQTVDLQTQNESQKQTGPETSGAPNKDIAPKILDEIVAAHNLPASHDEDRQKEGPQPTEKPSEALIKTGQDGHDTIRAPSSEDTPSNSLNLSLLDSVDLEDGGPSSAKTGLPTENGAGDGLIKDLNATKKQVTCRHGVEGGYGCILCANGAEMEPEREHSQLIEEPSEALVKTGQNGHDTTTPSSSEDAPSSSPNWSLLDSVDFEEEASSAKTGLPTKNGAEDGLIKDLNATKKQVTCRHGVEGGCPLCAMGAEIDDKSPHAPEKKLAASAPAKTFEKK
jgi:hypothetical protein